MSNLTSIQELVAEKLSSLARNEVYSGSPITLNIAKSHPHLEFRDSNDLSLKHDGDYQAKLKTLAQNEKVNVTNHDLQIKWDKNYVLQSVTLKIKELNYQGKSIGGLDLAFTVSNSKDELINRSGAGFLNRLRKGESANKFSNLEFLNLISDQDHKDVLKQRKAASKPGFVAMEVESEELQLDDSSLKLLRKLRNSVNRSQIFNSLVKIGVEDADSKRTIRHLIFPDEESKSKDPLHYQKRIFSRTLIQQLMVEYKA